MLYQLNYSHHCCPRTAQTVYPKTRSKEIRPHLADYQRKSKRDTLTNMDNDVSDGKSLISLLRRYFIIVIVGAGAGFASGLFGVGGGLIIVPALVLFLHMPQREASATSLASIVITAGVGSTTYFWTGNLSFIAVALLLPGMLLGAQLGVWLLHRVPDRILPWIYVTFVAFVIFAHRVHIPTRSSEVLWNAPAICGVVGVGLLAGFFSGLVGVGGGGVMVPGMELFVGLGDLLARGTSLLAMIPTAITGTLHHRKRGTVDVKTGLLLGLASAVLAPLGALCAGWISPELGATLFDGFLIFAAVAILFKPRRKGPQPSTK